VGLFIGVLIYVHDLSETKPHKHTECTRRPRQVAARRRLAVLRTGIRRHHGAQIADRAGLTKTTLFRYFADKGEILFRGQQALVAVAVDGVETAPQESGPLGVLHAAILALCTVHAAEQRAIGRRLDSVLSSSTELQERAASSGPPLWKRSTKP
jgi:hypothetical protein